MTDYRHRIGSHPANDEWRHYEFVRRTGLPRGTFGRTERDPDVIVWWACVALAAFVVGLMVFGVVA